MRKYVYSIICFVLWLSFLSPVQAQNTCFCVMAQDGRLLYGTGLHQTQSVASISKVMTAIVAMEHGDLSMKITIGEEINDAQGSSIYLKEGETYTLEELLYGLLLRSGNDAANSIAKAVGGKEENFVRWMNEKADELGMKDTLFRNPSGLDEEDGGNLSSVFDMALLMNDAMDHDEFAKITSAKSYTNEKGEQWINKNKLLSQYSYAIGGKTGYTKKAGRTLVSCAKKDDLQVVIVTFQVSDDFLFHQQYYERAFDEYETIALLKKGTYRIAGKDLQILRDERITKRKDALYQVNEICDETGYRLEANSEDHTVVYSHSWR